jgi:hypothetical protein
VKKTFCSAQTEASSVASNHKVIFRRHEHKTQTTEGTCNEDICAHLMLNYKRGDFYEQIQNSPFQNS